MKSVVTICQTGSEKKKEGEIVIIGWSEHITEMAFSHKSRAVSVIKI